jgi:hypothetical protein
VSIGTRAARAGRATVCPLLTTPSIEEIE